jgi:hypothetical protein
MLNRWLCVPSACSRWLCVPSACSRWLCVPSACSRLIHRGCVCACVCRDELSLLEEERQFSSERAVHHKVGCRPFPSLVSMSGPKQSLRSFRLLLPDCLCCASRVYRTSNYEHVFLLTWTKPSTPHPSTGDEAHPLRGELGDLQGRAAGHAQQVRATTLPSLCVVAVCVCFVLVRCMLQHL